MKKLVSLVLALFAASASGQVNNRGVIVKDEGSQLGLARTVDFVGSSVSCGISGGQATCTFTAGGITVGSAITSGTNGQLLYQDASGNLAQVSALAFDGSVVSFGGVAGSGENVVISNGTSTRSILLLKDNTTTVFTVADGGAVTAATNTFGISGSSAVLTVGAGSNAVIGTASAAFLHANASTNTMVQTLTSGLNSTGTAATGFGNGIKWQLESSTANNQDAGALGFVWQDATHATRSSAYVVQTVDQAGSLTERIRVMPPGGLKLATGTKPTCDSTYRGTIFYVAGGAGVLDTLEVCRKDAADNYAWISLF